MSRSGYIDELDQWDLIRYRGQVASAIRGKRGQAFLRDLLAALDAMPEKRLIAGTFERDDGDMCDRPEEVVEVSVEMADAGLVEIEEWDGIRTRAMAIRVYRAMESVRLAQVRQSAHSEIQASPAQKGRGAE